MPADRRAFHLGAIFALDSPFSHPDPKIFLERIPPATDPYGRGARGVDEAAPREDHQGAFDVARRGKNTAGNLDAKPVRIEGERLKPIRRVMREIERPDGTILRVEVPVYPPFKLKDRRKDKR